MTPDADRIGLRHALAGLAILAATGPAQAQDTGRLLSFGTSFGLIAEDNPDLLVDGGTGSVDAFLGLDLLLRRATRVQSLTLSGNAQLRSDDGSRDSSGGLAQSNLNLEYRRAVADTALGVTAAVRRDQVDFLDPLAIDLDDDLIIDEIDAVGRTGTRLSYRLDTRLELRRRAPLGVILSAGLSKVDYSDTNDPDLTDEERRRAGLGLRLDINPALRATVDVDYQDYLNPDPADDAADRDEWSVGARLARDLPVGSIGLNASVTSTDDGERLTLGFDRSFETPLWTVSADLGVTREISGDLTPVAEIEAARDLPTGQISASLRRSVRSNSDAEETLLSALSLNYAREVNRTLALSMGLSYVSTEPSGGGSSDSFASARVDLSKSLTRDWSVNLGVEHRAEDDGDIGRASSNRLSLSLRRAFATPR